MSEKKTTDKTPAPDPDANGGSIGSDQRRVWKTATEAQAKAYFAGEPSRDHVYRVAQQSGQSVLQVARK